MLSFKPQTVLVLSGPTASGKSALGLELAQHLPAVLINADSMQLYKGLPTLTAAPTVADFQQTPHRLFHVFPYDFQGNSVALWRDLALQEIKNALGQQRIPLVLGGTGFYLKALIQGISSMPTLSSKAKEAFLGATQHFETQDLYARLEKVDPELAATLSKGDRQRISRGLLVHQETGKPLSLWQREPIIPSLYHFHHINLIPPRGILKARIQARFEAGWDTMAQEVETFLTQDNAVASPLTQAAGFKEIQGYIMGKMDAATAKSTAITRIQQYAKRQITWFRHQLAKDITLEESDPSVGPILNGIFLK